jgi:hypothetical protein
MLGINKCNKTIFYFAIFSVALPDPSFPAFFFETYFA